MKKRVVKAKRPLAEDDIAKALLKSFGNMSVTAKLLGCTRQCIYERTRASERLQAVLAESREVMIDLAERSLADCVADRESWAVALLLKTIGRKRGYVEKQDINVNAKVDLSGSIDDDERKALKKLAKSMAVRPTTAPKDDDI